MINKKELKIEVKDLKFCDNGKVLLSVDFLSIDSPGITVIMGPNGAGKSLLLKLIQGIALPSKGQITLNGFPINDKRQSQSMVLQTPILLRLSVYQNMSMCFKRNNFFISNSEKHKIIDTLSRVGLGNKLSAPAKLLSGGEKQKLSLARSLISGPSILLVDEPTSTIDPSTTMLIEGLIKDQSKKGTKIIFVTHDIHQAFRLASDAIMIYRGKIVEQQNVVSFFENPKSDFTRDYLAGKLLV